MSRPIAGTLAESLSAQTRHYGFARNRQLCASTRAATTGPTSMRDRDLASDDRRRHRSFGSITGAHRTWLDPDGPATRRRSTRQDAQWATCSAMPSASALPTTSWRPAKASRRCSRFVALLPQHANDRGALGGASLRPSCFRERCDASTSRATMIRPANGASIDSHRPGDSGRDRGARSVATLGDFNDDLRYRGIDALRCSAHECSSRRRTSPVSWSSRDKPRHGMTERPYPRGKSANAMLPPSSGEGRAHGLLRGRSCGKRPGPAMAAADYFPARPEGRFPSRNKIAGLRHPPLRFGLRYARCRPAPPAAFVAMKAAMGAADPTKESAMTTNHDDPTPGLRPLIPDRPRSRRTPALWLPAFRRRTRPEAAAGRADDRRRRRRHLRRPRRDT